MAYTIFINSDGYYFKDPASPNYYKLTGFTGSTATFTNVGTTPPPGTAISAPNLNAALDTVLADAVAALNLHINDTTAAHAAASLSFTPASGLTSTNVQAAIAEAAAKVSTPSTTTKSLIPFHFNDSLSTSASFESFRMPYSGTITATKATVKIAPTGASVIPNMSKNGITIFTGNAGNPTIPAGSTISSVTVPPVTSFNANDLFSPSLNQVGSTEPGFGITIYLVVSWVL